MQEDHVPSVHLHPSNDDAQAQSLTSAEFMSKAPIPGKSFFKNPNFANRLTPDAPNGPSCPQAETKILDSRTLGSMQLWSLWCCETNDQLVTAPPTRMEPFSVGLIIKSSTAVALNSFTFGALEEHKVKQA